MAQASPAKGAGLYLADQNWAIVSSSLLIKLMEQAEALNLLSEQYGVRSKKIALVPEILGLSLNSASSYWLCNLEQVIVSFLGGEMRGLYGIS